MFIKRPGRDNKFNGLTSKWKSIIYRLLGSDFNSACLNLISVQNDRENTPGTLFCSIRQNSSDYEETSSNTWPAKISGTETLLKTHRIKIFSGIWREVNWYCECLRRNQAVVYSKYSLKVSLFFLPGKKLNTIPSFPSNDETSESFPRDIHMLLKLLSCMYVGIYMYVWAKCNPRSRSLPMLCTQIQPDPVWAPERKQNLPNVPRTVLDAQFNPKYPSPLSFHSIPILKKTRRDKRKSWKKFPARVVPIRLVLRWTSSEVRWMKGVYAKFLTKQRGGNNPTIFFFSHQKFQVYSSFFFPENPERYFPMSGIRSSALPAKQI